MLMNSSARALIAGRPDAKRTGTILAAMRAWAERRRSRRDLSKLDRRLLQDIGLTPGEAMREAAMPFWKV
jgi:uncharacterized protein YjiS (DUF1127 family)